MNSLFIIILLITILINCCTSYHYITGDIKKYIVISGNFTINGRSASLAHLSDTNE